MRYLILFEKGATSYGAYIPDLPGCVAVVETLEEVRTLIHEAMEMHLEDMRTTGQPIPEATKIDSEYVEASQQISGP
jgi:predicted RNase H-like HicB family nuclease